MARMFSKIFKKKPKAYVEQREAMRSGDVAARMSLARDSETNKEILYYLAEQDPAAQVRKAVAENMSAPSQVSPVLAEDVDSDVRLALAGRLLTLLPDVAVDQQSQLYAFTVQALGTLALDEVLKIRLALSATLKDHAHTPPKVAGQLARDVEREVSEPVLRLCAALSDEDLLDILKSHPASWVVAAVAGRESVSADVSSAVIETRDAQGGALLIGNERAEVGESLLHKIVEMARSLPEWQKPMAVRKALPLSVARDLAAYVDASVRDLLVSRGDFDAVEMEEIAAVFRRRVDFVEDGPREAAVDRLARLVAAGELCEEAISDALAMRDVEFVALAIAHLAKTSRGEVEKVFEMKAAKPIVAITWGAGLSMRLALQLQKDVGQVPPTELMYPKGGTDYPMSDEDLEWQLEFLGLSVV